MVSLAANSWVPAPRNEKSCVLAKEDASVADWEMMSEKESIPRDDEKPSISLLSIPAGYSTALLEK